MAEPTVISGTVRGPDGKPAAEARVYFTAGPVAFPEIAAVTDNKGRFSLTAPAPGEYVVACAADDLTGQSRTVKVPGGKKVVLNFQLER